MLINKGAEGFEEGYMYSESENKKKLSKTKELLEQFKDILDQIKEFIYN